MKDVKIAVQDVSIRRGNQSILENISFDCRSGRITSLIGPSGCGKSTLLRIFNRMIDLEPELKAEGTVYIDEVNIMDKFIDTVALRRKVGMVFQQSTIFPKSIFENIAFGVRLNGVQDTETVAGLVEESAQRASIWDEIKDRLGEPASALSAGQQQRLCIARALAVDPEILLMDEPSSSLDPVSTAKVEELIHDLRKKITIIIVTHNMQQAARLSDYTVFLYMGRLVEYDKTTRIFTNPSDERTEQYISGRFG